FGRVPSFINADAGNSGDQGNNNNFLGGSHGDQFGCGNSGGAGRNSGAGKTRSGDGGNQSGRSRLHRVGGNRGGQPACSDRDSSFGKKFPQSVHRAAHAFLRGLVADTEDFGNLRRGFFLEIP